MNSYNPTLDDKTKIIFHRIADSDDDEDEDSDVGFVRVGSLLARAIKASADEDEQIKKRTKQVLRRGGWQTEDEGKIINDLVDEAETGKKIAMAAVGLSILACIVCIVLNYTVGGTSALIGMIFAAVTSVFFIVSWIYESKSLSKYTKIKNNKLE